MLQGAPPVDNQPEFDIENSSIPSFASLQAERQVLFQNRHRIESFQRRVDELDASGEKGRRKGLGLWMIGKYAEAAQLLEAHGSDDVASFTCANALMSIGRCADARPIYERLSSAYPDEPKPRGGCIEAQLESDLSGGDEEVAAANLKKGLEDAPANFAESFYGRYLLGRLAEFDRNWEDALDRYAEARELDPSHRSNLFRLAYLAERCGLDELALECYETLATLHPIDRNVLVNLGILYEDLGRDMNAAACYDTVVRNEPTNTRAQLYLEDAKQAIDMYYDEDLERKEDRLNQILRIPITDFELSVRARNCLNKMNILSLGDLVKKTEAELLSYKNFGETSLNEIKEILGSKGLRLGMAREEAVASIETSTRRYTPGNTENAELHDRPIGSLELSIRARRTVEGLGCLTLGDVIQHSEEELLGMPNFGITSLQELKAKLAELGLKLKPRA